MVNLTSILCKYRPHWLLPSPNHFTPDKRACRREMLFRLVKNYFGRKRTAYKLARNEWQRSIIKSTRDRGKQGVFLKDLYSQRIWAATNEHVFPYKYFLGVLPQMGVELDRRVVAHLAIWEPRTFQALTQLCQGFVAENPIGEAGAEMTKPDGYNARGKFPKVNLK